MTDPFVRTTRPRVMVVEDDEAVAGAVADVLQATYEVIATGDLAVAKALIQQQCPDLLLTDCLLPGGSIDGLVAIARSFGAAVVLMSGDAGLLEPYCGYGYRCLLKPFGSALLLRTVAAAVDDTRLVGGKSPGTTRPPET